jgi:hypothetical protein
MTTRKTIYPVGRWPEDKQVLEQAIYDGYDEITLSAVNQNGDFTEWYLSSRTSFPTWTQFATGEAQEQGWLGGGYGYTPESTYDYANWRTGGLYYFWIFKNVVIKGERVRKHGAIQTTTIFGPLFYVGADYGSDRFDGAEFFISDYTGSGVKYPKLTLDTLNIEKFEAICVVCGAGDTITIKDCNFKEVYPSAAPWGSGSTAVIQVHSDLAPVSSIFYKTQPTEEQMAHGIVYYPFINHNLIIKDCYFDLNIPENRDIEDYHQLGIYLYEYPMFEIASVCSVNSTITGCTAVGCRNRFFGIGFNLPLDYDRQTKPKIIERNVAKGISVNNSYSYNNLFWLGIYSGAWFSGIEITSPANNAAATMLIRNNIIACDGWLSRCITCRNGTNIEIINNCFISGPNEDNPGGTSSISPVVSFEQSGLIMTNMFYGLLPPVDYFNDPNNPFGNKLYLADRIHNNIVNNNILKGTGGIGIGDSSLCIDILNMIFGYDSPDKDMFTCTFENNDFIRFREKFFIKDPDTGHVVLNDHGFTYQLSENTHDCTIIDDQRDLVNINNLGINNIIDRFWDRNPHKHHCHESIFPQHSGNHSELRMPHNRRRAD